jgi:hypothetical protein
VERARTWEEASHLLAERMPDVLIFDLAGDCESHVLPLLFKSPDMVLVGLDTEHNQAVLLSGRASQSLTLDQIRHIAAGERRGQGDEAVGGAAGSETSEAES